MKACKWCAEEIQDAAVVCRYCDRDQRSGEATRPARDAPATVGSMATTNTNAVVALVCALFLPFIGGIVAIVVGNKARQEIASSGGRQSGDGIALAAVILGWLQLAFFAFVMLAICSAASSGY